MIKRTLAVIAATAVLAASSVTSFAEYDPNKVVAENQIATKMITPEFKINVNGVEIAAPVPFENEGMLMLPLRAITETLGFDVEWQGETGTIILTKGPVYITMNAFEDGYTFSRTAPMMLGTAPILIDGVTFVPAEFITQVLSGAYRTEADGSIRIFDAETKDIALIESVNAEEKQIVVNDIVMGTVVLNISDETTITDEEGTPVEFEELVEGLTLKVTYGDAMTMSLPPINNPSVIVVKSGSPAMTLPSHEPVAEITPVPDAPVEVE